MMPILSRPMGEVFSILHGVNLAALAMRSFLFSPVFVEILNGRLTGPCFGVLQLRPVHVAIGSFFTVFVFVFVLSYPAVEKAHE